MMIRKECIGQKFSKKSPHNGCHFSGVISEDPENFALYKVLELDVFEKNIPPRAEIELEDKPKKKKKEDAAD